MPVGARLHVAQSHVYSGGVGVGSGAVVFVELGEKESVQVRGTFHGPLSHTDDKSVQQDGCGYDA